MTAPYEIRPVGYVESPLVIAGPHPSKAFEGAPEAWLVFDPRFAAGIRDLAIGDEVFVLTWLHQGRRDVLAVHPRDDPATRDGVVSTRSQDRPNPVGLHRVRSAAVDGPRVLVHDLKPWTAPHRGRQAGPRRWAVRALLHSR